VSAARVLLEFTEQTIELPRDLICKLMSPSSLLSIQFCNKCSCIFRPFENLSLAAQQRLCHCGTSDGANCMSGWVINSMSFLRMATLP